MRARLLTERRKRAMMRLRRMRRVRLPDATQRIMAWVVWGVSALFVLFQFSIQLSAGEMIGGMMQSFSISPVKAGIIASSYYYIYVLLQTPAGMVIDRFGARKVLSLGALVCALGTATFALAPSMTIAIIGRVLMGGGAAFAFVGSLYLIGRWFPVSQFSLMVGIAESIGMVGSLLGGLFMAYCVTHLGWRHLMMMASGVAVLLAVLIVLFVRDTPYEAKAPKSTRPKGSFRRDLKGLMVSKQAWCAGLYAGLMFSCVSVFVSLWGIPFIQKAHHVSLMQSTVLCNLVFIGVAVGTPIIGWLDAKVDRKYILSACAWLCALVMGVLLVLPTNNQFIIGVLMLLLGIVSSSYVLSFAIAHELSTPASSSAYMGFMNMLQMCFAPIVQPLVGWLLTFVALLHHQAGHGLSVLDYQLALVVIPIMTALAMVLVKHLPGRMPADEHHYESGASLLDHQPTT